MKNVKNILAALEKYRNEIMYMKFWYTDESIQIDVVFFHELRPGYQSERYLVNKIKSVEKTLDEFFKHLKGLGFDILERTGEPLKQYYPKYYVLALIEKIKTVSIEDDLSIEYTAIARAPQCRVIFNESDDAWIFVDNTDLLKQMFKNHKRYDLLLKL
jgi:hypothetical protein